MFLKQLEVYHHSTPSKNRKIKLVKVLFFIILVITGIVFSSLTETESATIFSSSLEIPVYLQGTETCGDNFNSELKEGI